MNFIWLIVLARDIQTTPPDSWLENFLPFELTPYDNPFECLGYTEECGEPVPIAPAFPGSEIPLETLQLLRSDGPVPYPSDYDYGPNIRPPRTNEATMVIRPAVSKVQRSYIPHPLVANTMVIPPAVSQTQTSGVPHPPVSRITTTLSPTRHSPLQPLDSSSGAASAKSAERAKWFSASHNSHTTHQNSICSKTVQSSMVFSQRLYKGAVRFHANRFEVKGDNTVMSYRITQDKIVLLDSSREIHLSDASLFFNWVQSNLNVAGLRIEKFRKHYPLVYDGLIVALDVNNQLLIASYGIPPLGVILFRPEGNRLKFIDRSSDDVVKALTVQEGDVVAVGPLEKILKLDSKSLTGDTSNVLDVVAEAVYDSRYDRSICIVAIISTNQIPQPKGTQTDSHPPPSSRGRKINPTIAKLSAGPQYEGTQSSLKSSNSSSESRDSSSQSGDQKERKRQVDMDHQKTTNLPGRVGWFQGARSCYYYSQTAAKSAKSAPVFSQRCYQGVVSSKNNNNHMDGRNAAMGYRVAEDRILLLDGYRAINPIKQNSDINWSTCNLSEAILKTKFRELYPLEIHGVVAALSNSNQLLMASYGKPPLGAALLRPEGNWLKLIDRSSDNAVKALNVQEGDIVIIGPLGRISQLELGTLQLNASNAPDIVVKTLYGAATNKTICIVATISIGQVSQPNIKPETHTTASAPGKSARQVNRPLQTTHSQADSQGTVG